MSKKNARKQQLDEEYHASLSVLNPIIFTMPDSFHQFYTPALMLPGKPPHRICRGRPS